MSEKKDFNALPPVTRLIVARCDLTDGTFFEIVTDLEPSQWDSISKKWLRKSKRLTIENLIEYVSSKKPYCICVSKKYYDTHIEPHGIPATKEEYDRENN